MKFCSGSGAASFCLLSSIRRLGKKKEGKREGGHHLFSADELALSRYQDKKFQQREFINNIIMTLLLTNS